METLNSVDDVNPTALAAFQDVSLEVDKLSEHYVAVNKNKNKNNNKNRKRNRRADGEDNQDEEVDGINSQKSEQELKMEQEFEKEKESLLAELADVERKLLSQRSAVLSLQEDISRFKQDEDAIDRRHNGLLHEESSVKSSAQSAGTRLQTARAGFARLGLSAAEGAALVEATFNNNNNNNNNNINSLLSTISALGSCLGAAYQLDVDDTIPRINGRRVGRLQHQNVTDEEINTGCGFLSLLMHHFLQSYTKMEKTGCCMEPQGSQSTITVFFPKRNSVDFHIKRKFFSWSTFGQAWIFFTICTQEVVSAMIIAMRAKAQKLRANASFSAGTPLANLVNRIDDQIASAQSLPKIHVTTARDGSNPTAKVDDNNVKYGDASDPMWTAAVNGLFRCLKWCIEAEKFLPD